MDDTDFVAVMTEAMTNLNAETEYELRHEDFVAEMPQSGELFTSREAMRELQRAFPDPPTFTIREIRGGGDFWVIEGTGDYSGRTYHVVLIVELRDGRIARETRYYADPFDPPEWRAQWVERMPA